MGCDIHFFVERRVDGKWKTADEWQRGKYDATRIVPRGDGYYGNRNYDLFAILANVRNGRGFAGIKTGEGFVPMSEPRGIPDDACPEYRAYAESWGDDGHSHSYLTVAEIMAYDWTQATKKQGWVTRKQYARYKINGAPDSWSGGVMGGSVKHVSNEEMEALDVDINTGKYNPLAQFYASDDAFITSIYTSVSWGIPYYEAGAEFLGCTLPRLWRLGAPDDVRCVFFFDN